MSSGIKKVTIGILAHVDAGKTTLSEAMLFKAGATRKLGRVDHGDALLDSDDQEKDRGITIFSGQAELVLGGPAESGGTAKADGGTEVILLDTPGHVDFSAEMERTLQVLDYAVLVISGKEGVQGHTVTLWKLLNYHKIPTFIFINKMDLDGTDEGAIIEELKEQLDGNCCGLRDMEELAMCDEVLMEEFLETETITTESLAKAIAGRRVFPCFFGSALKLEGVDEFMAGLNGLTLGYEEAAAIKTHINSADSGIKQTEGQNEISKSDLLTRVFKITRDKQGERLTHMKILAGTLKVRDEINGEKVNQIRIYSGEKFRTIDEAGPGQICAVTGLAQTQVEGDAQLEAVMTYSMILSEGVNLHEAYRKLKQLEEEDPQLRITWNEQLQEIQLRLMGKVQLEILQKVISRRFGLDVNFGEGRITYKETIAKPIEGAGHYEPLKHYSEVHLLLEPLPQGSGMKFASGVSEDKLDKNWQRLIMTHLREKEHAGTLTGSPITDMKITITAGRAHDKHTEGGDFRQSTYRAIRQGLRKSLEAGEVVLLEPWYDFQLEVPQDMVGRAMADVQRMGGTFQPPVNRGDMALLEGKAPVSEMKDYVTDVAAYTKGYGRLSCSLAGYDKCHNQDEVVTEIGYDADRDVDNPADSVFCSHGAGHSVPWNEADEMMHVASGWQPEGAAGEQEDVGGPGEAVGGSGGAKSGGGTGDKELERIFEKTYGTGGPKKANIEAREFDSELERRRKEAERRRRAKEAALRDEERNRPEYLLVDGYNIIFAWDDLKELAKVNIDGAREALIEILNNYQGFRKCNVMVVFDAYKVKGGQRHEEKQGEVVVVYTGEAETADTYIERTTYQLAGKSAESGGNSQGNRGSGRKYRVRVATSDRLEQMIIMGNNATKVSAKDFRSEVEQMNAEIQELIKKLTRQNDIENPNKLLDGQLINKSIQNQHKPVIK